ncbi:hypothetical protein N7E01_09080 [Neopusillimonas aromaticivorans]|nr:hypothetical protein [Neopusillimonas aromaticivorans]WJJ92531.1 hypothetical protein N7E01_09080 [Neopusillimonas aromaticivorans]
MFVKQTLQVRQDLPGLPGRAAPVKGIGVGVDGDHAGDKNEPPARSTGVYRNRGVGRTEDETT